MPDITRIVCPIDFSEPSHHAIEHAVTVARWYEAPILALHVHTAVRAPVTAFELVGVGAPGDEDPELALLRAATDDFVTTVSPPGAVIRVAVGLGSPAAEIVAEAGASPGTLIVMGTRGAGGLEHLLLGSVAEKVLRTASCPVMTVPPRARITSRLPFKRVLCPIDFSPASQHALSLAMSFAREGDAELTLLHVVTGLTPGETPPNSRAFYSPEYAGFRGRDALENLRALIPKEAADWCFPGAQLARGDPAGEILRFAADHRMDVIVMGVEGRSAFDQVVFGSTTNAVIRAATCPVVTLRREGSQS
ncbi:MAG TPA: universal stress protein [Vicinamibacterales bacterium]|jgi:nucleotide-binding universal stress UspA family protein